MSQTLKNKTILVTGSTRGIGKGIAEECLKEGGHVIIHGTQQVKVDEQVTSLNDLYPNKVQGFAADISSFENCEELIKKSLNATERIDVLVNNAGITRDNLVLRMSETDWNDVIQTNLSASFYLIKSLSRHFLKNKSGNIVNISSVIGLMGNAGQTNYAAAKAGLIGLTKSIAKEFGSKKIRCNAIAPGFIQTDMIDTLPEDKVKDIINSIPIKELGETKDVSELVVFLASEKSKYITGQTISVDGGMHI